MSPDKDKYLCDKYPELFRGRFKNMKETCMCWGFECGDGWFNIVDNLCTEITSFCIQACVEVPEVTQVKEKFGGLRFYIGGINVNVADAVWELIHQAELASYRTCEDCGKDGKLRGGGWLRTLCEEHKGDNPDYVPEEMP